MFLFMKKQTCLIYMLCRILHVSSKVVVRSRISPFFDISICRFLCLIITFDVMLEEFIYIIKHTKIRTILIIKYTC